MVVVKGGCGLVLWVAVRGLCMMVKARLLDCWTCVGGVLTAGMAVVLPC